RHPPLDVGVAHDRRADRNVRGGLLRHVAVSRRTTRARWTALVALAALPLVLRHARQVARRALVPTSER
ncbi:MAG TPA: hypothetical protein VEA99_10830, partial [Gemmatimonadaceae bacterium]|nr:hypothetical protein [Gemmatimonadaceae bacterium]